MNDQPVDRGSDAFKLALYRQALMRVVQEAGGSLVIEDMDSVPKGTLMNRAVPGGGWEFRFIPDREHGHA